MDAQPLLPDRNAGTILGSTGRSTTTEELGDGKASDMSNVFVVTVLAAGVGVGVLLIIRALQPRPRSLASTINSTRKPGRSITAPLITEDEWTASPWHRRLGRAGKRFMAMVR